MFRNRLPAVWVMSEPKILPVVEPGIPIPPRCAFGVWRDTVLKMKPGDSFKVETCNQRDTVLTHYSKKINGIVLTSRKLNGSGYRIWRVS